VIVVCVCVCVNNVYRLRMPRFEINVVEANALPSADLNGKSDPYVEVCTATERQKTDVKKATLNPVWRETKIVSIANPNTDGIGFLVYDWDRIGANDIIAYGYISVIGVPMNGAPLDAWVALYKKSKKAKKAEKKAEKSAKSGKPPKPGVPGGRLHLIVRALDVVAMPPPPMAGMPPPPMAGMPPPSDPLMRHRMRRMLWKGRKPDGPAFMPAPSCPTLEKKEVEKLSEEEEEKEKEEAAAVSSSSSSSCSSSDEKPAEAASSSSSSSEEEAEMKKDSSEESEESEESEDSEEEERKPQMMYPPEVMLWCKRQMKKKYFRRMCRAYTVWYTRMTMLSEYYTLMQQQQQYPFYYYYYPTPVGAPFMGNQPQYMYPGFYPQGPYGMGHHHHHHHHRLF